MFSYKYEELGKMMFNLKRKKGMNKKANVKTVIEVLAVGGHVQPW